MTRHLTAVGIAAISLGMLAPVVGLAAGRRASAPPSPSTSPSPVALPAAGVQIDRLEDGQAILARLPGRLAAYALPRMRDGRREVVLLVIPVPAPPPAAEGAKAGAKSPAAAPAAGQSPCAEPDASSASTAAAPEAALLLRIDRAGDGALVTLREDLPADAFGLESADLDGDGAEEILVARPGRLETLTDDGTARWARGPTLLMTDPYIAPERPARLEPRVARVPDGEAGRLLDIPILGGVRFYGASPDHRSWDLLYEAPLTLDAQRDDAGLKMTGERAVPMGLTAAGSALFASGPEPLGSERLRTVLIDPGAEGAARRLECWSRLPGAESLMEGAYLMLDGRPAMVAVTRRADKLSIFGEKMLRLFFLDEADRSRAGNPPLLMTDSHMNLWQPATPSIVDVDHDGRQDLVIGYWKGLKDAHVMLDAYLRQTDGTFARSPVSTGFDVETGRRSMVGYGKDLDGDGTADLMLMAADRLLIFPGVAGSRGGRDLVETKARWSVPLAGAEEDDNDRADFDIQFGVDGQSGSGMRTRFFIEPSSMPRAVDLDGDGRPEILRAVEGPEGRGVLQIIRLRPAH